MGRYPYPTHGWDAVKLYRSLSMEQLTEMNVFISSLPESQNPNHKTARDINLYTREARRKMDAVTWAITYHLQDKRNAEGQ